MSFIFKLQSSTASQADETTPNSTTSNFSPPQRGLSRLRAKVLEKDKIKRRNMVFILGFLLLSSLIATLALALKPSALQDSYLVNNIELLSNKEGLDFYNELEFYQWLDLATAEKAVD
ncbi:MAG TPA: hypothetical protein EYG68_09760 [Leucothrix mucor]|nr:hypothetical protein [Leucothrix mucor]